MCLLFREFSDITSSLSLFLFLEVRRLGGGDVPFVVCVSQLSTPTAGRAPPPLAVAGETAPGALATLLVLTGTADTRLGSSRPAWLPLDSGGGASAHAGSDWLGLCLGEGRSDGGEIRGLLSSDRGLSPLAGSSSSSLAHSSSSPAEALAAS